MKNTSVDVIIPTYNGLPWLKAAIDSVLAQTHKNLTLYVVDDGSTDKTKQHVKSLSDKRVVYIKKENGGQSTARNLGISKSSSPFVALLDSDDIWYEDKLEKQLEIMQKSPKVGLVYGYHYLIDEDDMILGNLRHSERGDVFDKLCSGNFISGSASMVLIRREILNKVGPFKEDFLIGEDWEMWLRIAAVCEVDFVPKIIAALRVRNDGMQQNFRKMADGLVYMYGVMKTELTLTKKQQQALADYSLFEAIRAYMKAGMRSKARRTTLLLFKEHPAAMVKKDRWGFRIAPSFFTHALVANPVFLLIGRVYRKLVGYPKKLILRSFGVKPNEGNI